MEETPMEAMENEFRENGLDDLADNLRDYGPAQTFDWLRTIKIPEAREEDRLYHHGEGWELPNLVVAHDRLADLLT